MYDICLYILAYISLVFFFLSTGQSWTSLHNHLLNYAEMKTSESPGISSLSRRTSSIIKMFTKMLISVLTRAPRFKRRIIVCVVEGVNFLFLEKERCGYACSISNKHRLKKKVLFFFLFGKGIGLLNCFWKISRFYTCMIISLIQAKCSL